MKKFFVLVTLSLLALAAQAQENEVVYASTPVVSADVAVFVTHPYHCAKFLGSGDDGDSLPASHSSALSAALKELGGTPRQALAQIRSICIQGATEVQVGSLN